jgi:hypothetical protein
MAKQIPPKGRVEIIEEVRKMLTEHFDCGIVIVSWEEQGTTYHLQSKFGNEYAVRTLARDADEILWPTEEEDEDEDEDEEEAEA